MIQSIQLKNWKSHRESSFEFQPGTNVLVGAMGSGKSSILQAISFALFGTFAELKHRDLKAIDVISRDAEIKVAEINLSLLSTQNKLFNIKRKIEETKNVSEGSVRDADGKLLAGPQTTQVNEFIKNELGIDDEIFLRTVYAMQNDIDMILKLAPKDRKKRIDELMGLNKFEIARNNCITFRNRLLRQKEDSESFLASIGLENLSNKINDINNQIENLKSKQLELNSELSKKKTEKDSARIIMLELREKFQEINKIIERKSGLLKQLNEISEKLKDFRLEKNISELNKEIEEFKIKIKKSQNEKKEISNSLETKRSEFSEADRRVIILENKEKELREKLEKITKLKEELSGMKVLDLNQERSEIKKELESRKEEKQTNSAELKNLREHLEHLSLAESECPVCNSKLTSESKNKLLSERKTKISKLLYRNTELSEIISTFEKRFSELEEIIDKNRKALEDLSNELSFEEEHKNINYELNIYKNSVTKLKIEVKSSSDRLSVIDDELEILNSKINSLNDQKYLYELKEQRTRIEEEIKIIDMDLDKKKITKEAVDKKEEEFQRFLKQVQEIETTLSNFENLMLEKTKQLAELKNQQNRAEELKNKIKEYEEKAGFLNKFKDALEATQLSLRDELILAVNEVMSQVWVDIYPYEKWSGVRLSSTEQDYTLQLKESGGDWVSVIGFASGGERMLASLAVRIAFARVLAPSLSLLILDEPTHNLDEKAITTFIDVVQNKVSDFLDQIFIVTHEEKLAENADHVIRL